MILTGCRLDFQPFLSSWCGARNRGSQNGWKSSLDRMPFVWKLKPISFWWATYTGVKTSNHGNVRNRQCTNVLARQTNLVNTCSCSHDPRTVLTNTKENYWNVSQIGSGFKLDWYNASMMLKYTRQFSFPCFSNLQEIHNLGCRSNKIWNVARIIWGVVNFNCYLVRK